MNAAGAWGNVSQNCILCFLSNFIKDEHNILTEKKAQEFQPGCYQDVLIRKYWKTSLSPDFWEKDAYLQWKSF